MKKKGTTHCRIMLSLTDGGQYQTQKTKQCAKKFQVSMKLIVKQMSSYEMI